MDPIAAVKVLRVGHPLTGAVVEGTLVLRDVAEPAANAVIRSPVTMVDTVLDKLDAGFITFEAPVALERVTILGFCLLHASFFLAGFTAVDCRFEQGADVRWGGHNKDPHAFRLERCEFDEFVDFEDEWFQGPVEIRGCSFHGGTNLLGNQGQPFVVSFDVPPVIESNTGNLDLDTSPAAG